MNNQLNFRVWYKNSWQDHCVIGKGFVRVFKVDDEMNLIPLNDAVLQFFTGKLDKAGDKIFEGDIIEYTEKLHEHGDAQTLRGVVVYDTDYAAFGIANPVDLNSVWNLFSDMTIYNFQVIGNIHENPNLLTLGIGRKHTV